MIKMILSVAIGIVTAAATASASEIEDHYATLGVDQKASPQDIFVAYWKARLRLNVFRVMFSRAALRRRSDIDFAYGLLKNPVTRRKFDLTRAGVQNSEKIRQFLATLRDPGFTSQIETSSQVMALQYALTLQTGDAVTGHEDQLAKFRTPVQLAALQAAGESIGHRVAFFYEELAAITNEYQLDALREILKRTNRISSPVLSAAARIDSSQKLAALRSRLSAEPLDVPSVIRLVNESCEIEML